MRTRAIVRRVCGVIVTNLITDAAGSNAAILRAVVNVLVIHAVIIILISIAPVIILIICRRNPTIFPDGINLWRSRNGKELVDRRKESLRLRNSWIRASSPVAEPNTI